MNQIQAKKISHWIKIYKLYRSAFPRNERKPFTVIRSMQKKGKTDVWYFEKNGEFAGLAITINGNDLILLDYFAISEKKRGMGMGSEILSQLQKYYTGKGFFCEIECVRDDTDNLEEKKRRKKFYLSNGMTEMHVNVKLFGVDMELLGCGCQLDFEEYLSFYRENYGEFAAKNILPGR